MVAERNRKWCYFMIAKNLLHERFERVEHHSLAINNVWVASGKRERPAEP